MSGDKSDRTPTTINLEDDLREWMDENNINRSDYLNEAARMRRDSKDRMEEILRESEIRRIQDEIESKESQLDRLKEERKQDREWSAADLRDAKESLEHTPKDPTNPAIQRKAKDLGMSPQELIEELESDDE